MTGLTIPENNCNPNAPVQTPICPSPQTHPHLYNKTDLLVPGAGWTWDILRFSGYGTAAGLNINSITASGFQGTTSFSTLESGYGPFIKALSLYDNHNPFNNKQIDTSSYYPLEYSSPPALIKGHPLVRRGKRNLNTTLTLSGLSLLYNDTFYWGDSGYPASPTNAPFTGGGKGTGGGSYYYKGLPQKVTINIKLPNQIGADTINPVNINGLRFSNVYLNVIVRLVSTTNDVNIYTFQVATWYPPSGNTSVSRGLTSRRERRLPRDQNRPNPTSNNRNGYQTGRSSSQIVSYLTNPENLAQPKVSDLEYRDWQTSLIATPICPCPTSHHHPSYPRTDILIPGCSWWWAQGYYGYCYGVSIPNITASGFRGVTGISTLNGAYGNVIKQLATKYKGKYVFDYGNPPGLQSGPVLVRTSSRNPNITLTLGAGATYLHSYGKPPNKSNVSLNNKRTNIPITLPTQVGAQMVFPSFAKSTSGQAIHFGGHQQWYKDNFVNVIIRLVSSINGVNIYTFDVGIFNSYTDD